MLAWRKIHGLGDSIEYLQPTLFAKAILKTGFFESHAYQDI